MRIPVVSPDWVMAQGLGGQRVDSELYRLRAGHEAELSEKRGKVLDAHARAEALRVELEAQGTEVEEPTLEADDVLAVASTSLPAKVQALEDARRTEEAFRIRHGLTRAAQAPDTLSSVAALFFMVFVESFANMGFFANAHMVAGPGAAFLTAFLISTANVGVSACAGFFIGRNLEYGFHAADADAPYFVAVRQRAAWQFTAYVALIAFFLLTIGLVRSTESLDVVAHGLGTYATLLSSPEAVLLMMVGGVMAVLAYHKGKTAFADPYPGYGERHRAVEAAEAELLDFHDELTGEIEARAEDAAKAFTTQIKAERKARAEHAKAMSAFFTTRRDLVRAADEAASALKTELALLVGHHRAASGKRQPSAVLNTEDFAQLADFSAFLDGLDPPPYFHPHQTGARLEELRAAKSRALGRLNTLFEDFSDAKETK